MTHTCFNFHGGSLIKFSFPVIYQSTVQSFWNFIYFYVVVLSAKFVRTVENALLWVLAQCAVNIYCDRTRFYIQNLGSEKEMTAVSQTTFSNAYSWMEMFKFDKKMVQLTSFQHWFRWWLGADQATSHYLNLWLLVYCRIHTSLGLIRIRISTDHLEKSPFPT